MAHPTAPMPDTRRDLHTHDGRRLGTFHDLDLLRTHGLGDPQRLPYTLRIVLESLLRHHDGGADTRNAIQAVLDWQPEATLRPDVPFTVARILAPDASGIPLLADLAAMRDAACAQGAPASAIAPLLPVDMVVDHSLQVERAGTADALEFNMQMEFSRNAERYSFLKWAAQAFDHIRVVPPGNGILHQINLEYLAHHVCQAGDMLYPDSVIGPDSHTAMINGLGVLGWGVGGIEAEAAMLGQPLALSLPDVIAVELTGSPPTGVLATDVVLTLTQQLRQAGVVGKFVEFIGDGAISLSAADRCTIANMAPEYGATAAFFPVDERTMDFLRQTGRTAAQLERIHTYWHAQHMFGAATPGQIAYSGHLVIDLSAMRPSVSGPRRPQDRIGLDALQTQFHQLLTQPVEQGGFGRPADAGLVRHAATATHNADTTAAPDTPADAAPVPLTPPLCDGDIVIAAITSCANTSNPSLLLAAGLLARNAVARGLTPAPHVKTSFTPGSKAVPVYLRQAGLLDSLEALGFQVAGFGCGTCMGNSGPLPEPIESAISARQLVVAAVLSGNRNFEARIHPAIRANYLMSPPLVVAFAIAGRILDPATEPLGHDPQGQPVYLHDLWPSADDIATLLPCATDPGHFAHGYTRTAMANPLWDALPAPTDSQFAWDPASTYLRRPPFLEHVGRQPGTLSPLTGARALAILGDSVTTDHISPGGSIGSDSPAGRYLQELGIPPEQFNTYVARRANHEVMVRGTFANVRLRNAMAGGIEGGMTRQQPGGALMPIYDAAMIYAAQDIPLVVFAGKEYGTGSSRDWAAKGTRLLGIRAVIATSFERIHRSNLVGMGILPCEFTDGQDAASLMLDGSEHFDLDGVGPDVAPGQMLRLRITRRDGSQTHATLRLRVDTQREADCIRHGGVMPYVLRQQLTKLDNQPSPTGRGTAHHVTPLH